MIEIREPGFEPFIERQNSVMQCLRSMYTLIANTISRLRPSPETEACQ